MSTQHQVIDFRAALRMKLHDAMLAVHNSMAVVDGALVKLPGHEAAVAEHERVKAAYDFAGKAVRQGT